MLLYSAASPEASHYTQLIHDSDRCLISAANLLELHTVIEGQMGTDAGRQCDVFVRSAGIFVEPVTIEHGQLVAGLFKLRKA